MYYFALLHITLYHFVLPAQSAALTYIHILGAKQRPTGRCQPSCVVLPWQDLTSVTNITIMNTIITTITNINTINKLNGGIGC